jgi:hypothetical protein
MVLNVKITWKNKLNDMAHGKNAEKKGQNGKEWWGKRPLNNLSVSNNKGMKFWKKLLHKIERRQGKNQTSNDNEV